jgi:hypothetical protein
MKKKQSKDIADDQQRWDFIRKVSKEVDDWPEWKKVEINPGKFNTEKEGEAKTMSLNETPKMIA